MKIKIRQKKRKFYAGKNKKICFSDVGKIYLKPNELITFVTENLSKHDVVRKDWGFYATQSINSRLKKNFKTALVIDSIKRIFIMVVERKFLKKFKKYCKEEQQQVLCWLDEL